MPTKDFELKKNEFLRQFESTIENELVKVEYAEQERKIFLSKFVISDSLQEKGYDEAFLHKVFEHIQEKGRMRVVPTSKRVKSFFRANKTRYSDLLPIGITL